MGLGPRRPFSIPTRIGERSDQGYRKCGPGGTALEPDSAGLSALRNEILVTMIRFKLSRSHEQIRGVLDGIRILSDSGSVRERLIDYGAWLYSSERSLCSIADDEDVAALLHSPRHRRLIQAATTVGHYQEGEAYTNLMSQQLGLEVEATIRKSRTCETKSKPPTSGGPKPSRSLSSTPHW